MFPSWGEPQSGVGTDLHRSRRERVARRSLEWAGQHAGRTCFRFQGRSRMPGSVFRKTPVPCAEGAATPLHARHAATTLFASSRCRDCTSPKRPPPRPRSRRWRKLRS